MSLLGVVFFFKKNFLWCNWDAGNYPEWDEDHPIHFVGHSAGAQVVRVLQQMLADKVSTFLCMESIKKYICKCS